MTSLRRQKFAASRNDCYQPPCSLAPTAFGSDADVNAENAAIEASSLALTSRRQPIAPSAASIHQRIAIGPNAGQKALTLRTVPAPSEPFASTLLAKQPGFSLHAVTCREANQPDKLDKLCHYITRPAIANERLSTNERGPVIYRFKQPFRDGTTHVVLNPLELMAHIHVRHPAGDLRSSKMARLRYGGGG